MIVQLEDYVLPRLVQIDARAHPRRWVDDAGKSTLVNSLVGERVSETGILRPTTGWTVRTSATAVAPSSTIAQAGAPPTGCDRRDRIVRAIVAQPVAGQRRPFRRRSGGPLETASVTTRPYARAKRVT